MGFISIANSPENRRDGVFRQQWITRYTRARNFDLSRIRIVRTLTEGDLRIRFWRIPPGATAPPLNLDESYEIPQTVKPFLFGWETRDDFGDPICPAIDHGYIFARFLKANPSARANLVVRAKSLRSARRNSGLIVNRLVKKYGIKRSRIRVFLRERELSQLASWLPITEFWFLP